MKKQVPIEPGLFTLPPSADASPHLLGSRCDDCGAVAFPARNSCTKCGSESVRQVHLSSRGKIYSSTIHWHKKAPHYYNGPIPYAFGFVELPEGVMVPARLNDFPLVNPPEIGTEVELVLETWESDPEGNDVVSYAFRPARN